MVTGQHRFRDFFTIFKNALGQARIIVGMTFCCAFIGCAGRSDLGQVTGKVTLDGEPIENAFVEFTPVNEGSLASGKTDSSGEYSLMFSRDVAGASLGENLVRISTHDIAYVEGEGEVAIPEKIPSKYNRNTELKAQVEPGRNRFDFDLTSDGGKIIQPRIAP